VLSNEELRKQYDKYGKESARPSEGFVDPAEFFSMIFGGEAFMDWIGEISLMKDLTATLNITMDGAEENEEAAAAAAAAAATTGEADASGEKKPAAPKVVIEDETGEKVASDGPTPQGSGAATPGGSWSTQIPIRPALMDKSSEEPAAHAAQEDVSKRKEKDKKSKGALSKEQREKLEQYEKERAEARQKRVKMLTEKLIDRLSILTEAEPVTKEVKEAFKEKIKLEVEELKMNSFGVDILHAIGQVYVTKGTTLLRSQKFFGVGGFFARMKEKGTVVKDTWNTISSAIDAQATMEEMARLEAQGGEDWTEEKRVEYEQRVTGKILTAAWRGSKFEIQSVLREVCDAVLYDKKVPLAKRLQRAEALVIVGQICSEVSLFLMLFRCPSSS